MFWLLGLLAIVLAGGLLAAGPTSASSTSNVASAWGDNTYGELGDGQTGWAYDSKVPTAVSGLSGVRSIAAGGADGLALMEDGTVVAWGNNGGGDLGDGTTTQRDVPVAVSGLSGVTAIAAGDSHDLALLSDGTVMAWGRNDQGQLGNGTTTGPETCESELPCSTTPVAVSGLSRVKAIAAGYNYSLALLSDGTVMAWGENTWGQLGDGSASGPQTCAEALPCSPTPVAVSGLSRTTAVAAGFNHSLALLEDGTVMSWGYNGSGQLGDGATIGPEVCAGELRCSPTPVPVGGLSDVTAIAAGGLHSLALLSDGTVRAWGYNLVGQLGNGTTNDSDVPVAVSGLGGVTAISGGMYDSLALLSDGTVMAWGGNVLWQLGNNTAKEESLVPIPVSGLSEVTAIAAGDGQSYAAAAAPVALPQIAKLEPNSGEEAGGTVVTITGSNFTGATAVKFGPNNAASFTVNSDNSITAASPPGTGTVDVTVMTPHGTSYASPRDFFNYVGAPTVEMVEPDHGPASGRTSVTITGTGFTGASAVEFGATEAAGFEVHSDTEITAISPPGSGTVDVEVQNAEGTSSTSSSDLFAYGPPEGTQANSNQVQILSCSAVKRTAVNSVQSLRRQVITARVCTSDLVSGPLGSTSGAGALAARLMRGNMLYTTGTATVSHANTRRALMALKPLRRVGPGRYRLTLASRRSLRQETITVR